MRQWIEYAVENYRSKNSFGFQLAKDLKPRQIDMAIDQYARIVKPEEVVALLDTTLVKSGKSGFLLTDRYLYSSNEKEEAPVELMYLKSVSVREENNSYCVLEYEDGRKRELYVSVFLDVVDILEIIISQKESRETEGEKKSVKSDPEGSAKEQTREVRPEVLELERRVDTSLDVIGEEKKKDTGRNVEGREPAARKSSGTAVAEKGEETESETAGKEPKTEPEAVSKAAESGLNLKAEQNTSEKENEPEPGSPIAEPEQIIESPETAEPEQVKENLETAEPEQIIESPETAEPKHSIELADSELSDGLPKELSLEIVALDDVEDEDSEESDEPFWDTDTLRTELDVQEPYEQVLEKAEAGDEAAMYKAAEMLYVGYGTLQDRKEALRWFRESAKAAYVPAMLKLMQFYNDGELVKKNLTLSMSWGKKAAATGEPEGQYALAKAYIYGEPEIQDTDKGLKLLVDMVQQGDAAAEDMIQEVHRKMRKAKESFDQGIRNPSTASGYYEMGMYCKEGDGYHRYLKEAAEYFRKAAEKEHIQAQYQLALAYYTGAGVKKDEAESIRWLEKAAAKSHKEAGELLAELREKQRIKQEKTEFKNHLRQAEKGDAYAQSKVAGMYLRGTGVKKDIKKGIEWYEKASEMDEGYAARQLAKLYAEGDIIPADPERAAYWRMVGGILDDL